MLRLEWANPPKDRAVAIVEIANEASKFVAHKRAGIAARAELETIYGLDAADVKVETLPVLGKNKHRFRVTMTGLAKMLPIETVVERLA